MLSSLLNSDNLLDHRSLYIIALSGGADSVALLLMMKEKGYKIQAAHCNFHLRGEESDRDEQFCIDLCKRLGIELHRVHFDTQIYAELHRVSIEMAARELRYRWFSQLRQDLGAAAVCVAHHRDDSVETVILNLVRGTGLRGLTGIQPRSVLKTDVAEGSELTVLRPLLGASRVEIEQYLAERNQEYVTDSTNLEANVLRNKVRLQVLPLLRELNPAAAENIQRTAENLASAQAALNTVLSGYQRSNTLKLSAFTDCASREYIAFEWLKKYGFNGSQLRQILVAETGSVISSRQGFDVLKDRDSLLVEPSLQPMKPLKIPEEGTYQLPANAILKSKPAGESLVFSSANAKIMLRKRPVYISKSPDVATLDASKVKFPLTVRRLEEGDWMQPYGMKGRKLLSDLMTDRRMTVFAKRRQLLVTDAEGVVVWAVGLRTSQQAAVMEETSEILEIKLEISD